MIDDFKPSTLTTPMPSENAFYNLWLNPTLMAIVSNYMGFYPHLTEAYIRRISLYFSGYEPQLAP